MLSENHSAQRKDLYKFYVKTFSMFKLRLMYGRQLGFTVSVTDTQSIKFGSFQMLWKLILIFENDPTINRDIKKQN